MAGPSCDHSPLLPYTWYFVWPLPLKFQPKFLWASARSVLIGCAAFSRVKAQPYTLIILVCHWCPLWYWCKKSEWCMDIAFNLLVRRWLTGQEVDGIKIFRIKGLEHFGRILFFFSPYPFITIYRMLLQFNFELWYLQNYQMNDVFMSRSDAK